MQANQSFRTIDLISLVAFVGIIGSGSGVVLAQAFQDDRPLRARHAAENYSRQIQLRENAPEEAIADKVSRGGRQPASIASTGVSSAKVHLTEGTLGKDPWGNPFHYVVQTSRIYVWSDGPNGHPESVVVASSEAPAKFGGDDIGSVTATHPLSR